MGCTAPIVAQIPGRSQMFDMFTQKCIFPSERIACQCEVASMHIMCIIIKMRFEVSTQRPSSNDVASIIKRFVCANLTEFQS